MYNIALNYLFVEYLNKALYNTFVSAAAQQNKMLWKRLEVTETQSRQEIQGLTACFLKML